MHTRCPHCKTLYQITESQLQAASGRVRCCCCDNIFNAKKNLFTPAEPATPDDGVDGPIITAPGLLTELPPESSRAHNPPSLFLDQQAADEKSANPPPLANPDDTEHWPDLALPGPAPKKETHTLAWILSILILTLSATTQAIWFSKDRLAQLSNLRPLMTQLCSMLGCSLAPWKDPSRFHILSRSVEPDPEGLGALHIQLVFMNRADFSQPYPQLQLELFDKDQHLAARTRFGPEQYLTSQVSIHSLVKPGQSTALDMYLTDPGKDVVGFRFDFL